MEDGTIECQTCGNNWGNEEDAQMCTDGDNFVSRVRELQRRIDAS